MSGGEVMRMYEDDVRLFHDENETSIGRNIFGVVFCHHLFPFIF